MNLRLLIETFLRENDTDLADTIELRNLELDLPSEANDPATLRDAAETIRGALEEHAYALTWISILDGLARQALVAADKLEGIDNPEVTPPAQPAGSFRLPGSEGRDMSLMYATMLKRKAIRLLEERSEATDDRKQAIYDLPEETMEPFVAELREVSPEDGPSYNQKMIEIAGSILLLLGH